MSHLHLTLLIGTMILITAICAVVSINTGQYYLKHRNTTWSTSDVRADCEQAVASGDYSASPRGDLSSVDLCVEDTFMSFPFYSISQAIALGVTIVFGMMGPVYLGTAIVLLIRHIRKHAVAAK